MDNLVHCGEKIYTMAKTLNLVDDRLYDCLLQLYNMRRE